MRAINIPFTVALFLATAIIFGCGQTEEASTTAETETGNEADTGGSTETSTADSFPSRTFESGFIEGCEGNQISYNKWADDGEPYATLIFSTGRSEYTDKYHHLIPLIDRNVDIVFYDHIGQGRSDGTRAHVNDVDAEHACDLREVARQLTDENLPRFILAHSMGSLGTVRALQLQPDLAVAAAFSSPMWGLIFPGGVDVETARTLAVSQVETGNGEAPIIPPDGSPVDTCEEAKITHDCELYDQFANDPLTMIGSATWGAGLAFLNAIDLMMASLADVKVPFFIQAAGDEHYVDATSHPAVCDGINAIYPEQCRLVVHENDWHELLNEVDRATYMADYLDFFDSHLPE
jgi:alpha-beta hydrolase superfamily lysophospholipase